MKTLVTGAAGFIGLRLSKYLAETGAQVHMIDKITPPSSDTDFHSVANLRNVEFLTLDALNEENLKKLDADYTHIIHLAALLGVQNVLDNPFDVIECNHRLTSNFLNIARQQLKKPRFLFSSTSEVYAGTMAAGSLAIPSPENSAIVLPSLSQPRTSYMLSKLYGEALCAYSGLPFTIIRPHNIYGPRMGMRHVIPQLLYRAYYNDSDELEVFSPTHTRTFCYVDDAVDMIVSLLHSEAAVNQTFNIGHQSPEIKISDLAKIIIEQVRKPMSLKESIDTDGSPSRRAPHMGKLHQTIGNIQETHIYEGINKTFQWYLENNFK